MAPGYRQKKHSTKITKTLLIITWLLLIALLAFGAYIAVGEARNMEKRNSALISAPSPQKTFNARVLLIFTDTTEQNLTKFLLLKFDPGNQTISAAMLPEDMDTAVRYKSGSLTKQYEYGGAIQAKLAVENALSITVDRYAVCPLTVLESMVESLGGAEYTLENEMYYKDSAGVVVTDLKAGLQTLNGQQVVKFLRYPKWATQAQAANEQAKLCSAIINQYADLKTVEKMPSLYGDVINQLVTDISVMDISELQSRYSAFVNADKPAKAIEISGTEDNGFTVSEAALKQLKQAFK